MSISDFGDLKTLAILIGFIAGYAVLMWRMGAAEATIRGHDEKLDDLARSTSAATQLHIDVERRMTRIEDQIWRGPSP